MDRSMRWRRAGICAVILTASMAAERSTLLAADAPSAAKTKEKAEAISAKAAVLKRFAGNWKTQTSLRRPGPPAQEIKTSGKADCRSTLGGRYYEFRTETVPAGDSDLQVMTYDDPAGVYRQWVFSSDGYRHEATGVWDDTTSTMTWQGKTDDGAFVIEDRWASADRLEWTLVRKDASGKVVQTITGTVSRVQ